MNKLNNFPKVLVATPVSIRHKHLLDEWIKSLDNLTYPYFDVLVVDTTPDSDRYYKLLKTKKVKGNKIKVLRTKWNYKKDHVVQMLAKAREKIRLFAIKNNYDYLFSLDDDIFIPENSIERLLSYNKDCVGFYVHIYQGKLKRPCILKNGEVVMGEGIQLLTFEELNAYKNFVKKFRENKLSPEESKLAPFLIKDPLKPHLLNPYAVNLGCLMIKREVFKEVPFRTHPTFIFGEDLWWFNEARDKRFDFWCDTDVRAVHKNTSWKEVIEKGPKKNMDFYIALGPEKADKLVFINRKNGGRK